MGLYRIIIVEDVRASNLQDAKDTFRDAIEAGDVTIMACLLGEEHEDENIERKPDRNVLDFRTEKNRRRDPES